VLNGENLANSDRSSSMCRVRSSFVEIRIRMSNWPTLDVLQLVDVPFLKELEKFSLLNSGIFSATCETGKVCRISTKLAIRVENALVLEKVESECRKDRHSTTYDSFRRLF
jgi:hypothetical protein